MKYDEKDRSFTLEQGDFDPPTLEQILSERDDSEAQTVARNLASTQRYVNDMLSDIFGRRGL